MELFPSQAPFLFKSDGDSKWASTSAELLAVLMALHVFGCFATAGSSDPTPLVVSAGTDNSANDYLVKKGLSTKWPLCLIFMQMTKSMMGAGILVNLKWRPRDENALADALTNQVFDDVDLKKRIECSLEDVDLDLLWTLWAQREAYLDRDALKKEAVILKLGEFEKSAW